MQLFSDAWADAWREAINDDPEYRTAGANWEGPVVLRHSDVFDTGVFVALSGGTCHEARKAGPEDESAALIVIEAPEVTWHSVLAGDIDPVMGLVRGELTLAKGSLLTLMPHQASARALLAAAVRVGSGGDLVEDEG